MPSYLIFHFLIGPMVLVMALVFLYFFKNPKTSSQIAGKYAAEGMLLLGVGLVIIQFFLKLVSGNDHRAVVYSFIIAMLGLLFIAYKTSIVLTNSKTKEPKKRAQA